MQERRVAHETARLRLARYKLAGVQTRSAACEHASRVSAEALGVERVGVWLLKDRGQRPHGMAAALLAACLPTRSTRSSMAK